MKCFPYSRLTHPIISLKSMTISFTELRILKDKLPSGSMKRIAEMLHLSEDTVRNYFGGTHLQSGNLPGVHIEPGPGGGLVRLDDDTIYCLALEILNEQGGLVAE